MPLELIGELGISLGILLYSRWRGGNERQRAFSEMLTAATPDAQRAALEIMSTERTVQIQTAIQTGSDL